MARKRTRRTALVWGLAVASTAVLATACTAILGLDETRLRDETMEDGGPDAAAPIDEAGPAGLAVSPDIVFLRRGTSFDVTVTVPSPAPPGGAIRVSVAGLPDGVRVASLVLEGGATSGTLRFAAAPDAALGRAALEVRVDLADVPARPLSLLVAGSAGAVDPTFDGDGIVEIGGGGRVTALAVDDADRIVAGGVTTADGGPGGWFVARFGEGGGRDVAFAAALPPLPEHGELSAIARAPSGRILVAGGAIGDGGLAVPTVLRLLPSGAVDSAFGQGGFVRLALPDALAGARALSLAVLADESVVVVGERGEDGFVARLAESGAAHPDFVTPVVVAATRLVGVVPSSSTAVVVGGTERVGPTTRLVLERRFLDGGLDETFGAAGALHFATTFEARALVAEASGALALAGGTSAASGTAPYTVAGATAGGVELFARGVATAPGARFYGAASSSLGLVAAGHAQGANAEARVARMFDDAGLDPTFGTAGFALLDSPDAGDARDLALFGVATHRDGRIVVGGARTDVGPVLMRLWP